MSNRRSAGRILPHERDANNEAPILGDNLDLGGDYAAALQQTLALEMDDKTRKDYRRRLIRIAKFWDEHHPNHALIATKVVSEPDLSDPSKYYFNYYKRDLIYTGFNVKFLIAFLLKTKYKQGATGKIKQFGDIRKYKDAILWGSSIAQSPLPTEFYTGIDQYLKSYKKEAVVAKKNGLVDEHGADPIPTSLYRLICQWSIQNNNIFMWFWTLYQWNTMARCASIDPLAFHNMSLGRDSVICKYDDSKTKKAGEKLSEKNIYANPIDFFLCWWTSFAIYCSINSDKLSKFERLFLKPGVKFGTASGRYQDQLLGLVKKMKNIVQNHIRLDHMNAYGLRKGSATLATSGITCPPPISSIARRGEWSMGAVLDVYWHFSEPGDHYLGRILAGLDPNKAEFGTLPPHFIVPDPMSHPDIKRGMEMLYGPILDAYEGKPNDPSALILRCFPSLIHHSDKLITVMVENPGHDFTKMPLLHDRELLHKLKALVTLEPTINIMDVATGIPPHVSLAVQTRVSYNCNFLFLKTKQIY